MGFIVAFWLPELLTNLQKQLPESQDHDRAEMFHMLIKEAVIISVGIIPGILVYRDHPEIPPSETSVQETMPYTQAWKILCKKKDYKFQTYLVVM